jgi:hypothetical protein
VTYTRSPAAGRHDHAGAGQRLVVSGVARLGDPLEMLRWGHHGVMRDGIVAGVVERVGPLVDLRAARFDRLLPRAAGADVGDATGGEYAADLVGRHSALVF